MDKSNVLAVNGQVLPQEQLPRGFSQISNAILLDERLSFKARGILALLISRPQGWQVYVKELTKRSNKDGRRAVQSGLKELAEWGYIALLPIYNDETGRFEGSFYKLRKEKNLIGQARFRIVPELDSPQTRLTDVPPTENIDHPETSLLSNTDSSNKEKTNTKQQQHKDYPVIDEKNDIQFFSKSLKGDTIWHTHFLKHEVLKDANSLLSKSDFEGLLRHFEETSLQQGCIYQNLEEVKRHFANWFNANHAKGALVCFIKEYRRKGNKAKTQTGSLLGKAERLFSKIQDKQCKNDVEVLQTKVNLLRIHTKLAKLLPYLTTDSTIQALVTTALSNIETLCQQIDRGEKAKRLDWYCRADGEHVTK